MPTARKTIKKKPIKAVSSRTTKTAARKNTKPTTARKAAAPAKSKSAIGENANGKNANRTNGNGQVSKSPAAIKKPLLNQKETLQQERVNVEGELERLRAELQEAPEMTGDEVDLNVYEREKTLGLVATYERRLEEIQATIQVAAEGKYGICERCGKQIDPERLAIFPETRLCIDCKNKVEREQRRLRLG